MASPEIKNNLVVVVRTPAILGRPVAPAFISDSFKSNKEHDDAVASGQLTPGRKMTRAKAEIFIKEWNEKNNFNDETEN